MNLGQKNTSAHTNGLCISIITQYIMSGFQQKITSMYKSKEKTQSEEIKQVTEPGSDTTEILKLSYQEFKRTLHNNKGVNTPRRHNNP